MAINIWSDLLKSESITEIYVPPDLDLEVSLQDFYDVLNKQLQEKRVANVNLSIQDVRWDEGKQNQQRIVARYTGSDAPKNIQQILIGLDDMGSFRYVEEKTFLARPELPKYPRNTVPEPSSGPEFTRVLWGAGIGVVSLALMGVNVLIGLVGLIIAGAIIALYVKSKSEYSSNLASAQSNNRSAAEETKNWNNAWSSWRNNVLETAYLQATTNSFGRFQRAISSCVKLTIGELFEDKKAELKDTKAREINERQIEEQIKKKQESFK